MRGSNSRDIFNSCRGALARALVLLICVGTSSFHPAALAAEVPQADMCQVAERALREVSGIRGLVAKERVPCLVKSREEIERFLRKMIAEKFPADTLEMEQVVYRAIGVIPDDYDYVHGIVKAYVNQIGGYYDPDTKQFVMLDSMQTALHLPVAVHELTHAIQDQHFKLTTFLDPKMENNDQLMARAALVEGDATSVMQNFMRREKEVLPSKKTIIEKIRVPLESDESEAPVPDALQKILFFPYIEGLTFTQRLIESGGYSAVNKAFTNPPKSSRQILHPEEFLIGAVSTEVPALETLERLEPGDALIYSDTIGEFAVSVLLGDSIASPQRGKKCAQGLRGDRVGVFQPARGPRYLSWRSEWDSDHDAQEFVGCFKALTTAQYKVELSAEFVQLTSTKRIKVASSGRVVSVVIEAP